MKRLAVALCLIAACGSESADVTAEFEDAGGGGEDAGYDSDSGTAEPDAGSDGEDAGAVDLPLPMLERACTQETEFTTCPTGTGQTYTALCSPENLCSFLCDRCKAPGSVPEADRADWEARCEAGYQPGQFEMVSERVSDCADLGGTCVEMTGRTLFGSGTRHWCAL